MLDMHLTDIQKELQTLRSIFSTNEERVNQLSRREIVLKKRLGVKQ